MSEQQNPKDAGVNKIDPKKESQRPVNQPVEGKTSGGIAPELVNLLDKVALVALSYFDVREELLRVQQLAGTVVRVTPQDGITLRILNEDNEFTLPSDVSCWFKAPGGDYPVGDKGQPVSNPDFLVTWDVYKMKDKNKPEKEHEWWNWVPRTAAPSVNA